MIVFERWLCEGYRGDTPCLHTLFGFDGQAITLDELRRVMQLKCPRCGYVNGRSPREATLKGRERATLEAMR